MNSTAQRSADTALTPIRVDTVASTAAGFLRALNLETDVLSEPWVTICALSTGAWIDISPPYGTPAERLDLISEAADALGADAASIRYMPNGATFSNVEVHGEWAECPITVRTSIATTDLVDIETDRAVAATCNGEPLAQWLADERRAAAGFEDWQDRAAEDRD